MNPMAIREPIEEKAIPLCPVFGTCGGCAYQDLPYATELRLKEQNLKRLFRNHWDMPDDLFNPVVASPKTYHYRNRLDIAMRRSQGRVLVGFQSPALRHIVPIEGCPIALEAISDFIPKLKDEAIRKLPPDYRTANLVVRTGDDGRVLWGGIGRRSLRLKEGDYLWTEIEGRKIFYSLETFFQANLSILPKVIRKLRSLAGLDAETLFLDFFAGVGLFGLCLAPLAGRVLMVEDCTASVQLAKYNIKTLGLTHVEIRSERVEEALPHLDTSGFKKIVAMIDPPRQGLSRQVAGALSGMRNLSALFYLSCHPESLVRDLAVFLEKGWSMEAIVPFDFFPRTPHLETLVHLKL